ncbi:MAG: heavy metal-associated domain-containing protein [Candidatus Micrarchaeota archaeon]
MAHAKLKIGGMHCTSCEKMISMAVDGVGGAKIVSISSQKGEAIIDAKDESSLNEAKKAIKEEGYDVQ